MQPVARHFPLRFRRRTGPSLRARIACSVGRIALFTIGGIALAAVLVACILGALAVGDALTTR